MIIERYIIRIRTGDSPDQFLAERPIKGYDFYHSPFQATLYDYDLAGKKVVERVIMEVCEYADLVPKYFEVIPLRLILPK
jgi:hypothetical protein